MGDGDVMKLKILISMNSSTSFIECDRLFMTEFLGFDRAIADKIRSENESYEAIQKQLGR